MPKEVIFTLNARGNIALEVSRDYFNIPPERMRLEIQAMHREVVSILNGKGIDYTDLKSALVPNPKRREIALFFDSERIDSSSYGRPIHERLVTLLPKESNHSIRAGDYIGRGSQQEILFDAFEESVTPVREIVWQYSNQFYVVYINNLSPTMYESFVEGLVDFEPFVGYADMTFASALKIFLSICLVSLYIKNRSTIIMGHEDDRPNDEDHVMFDYKYKEKGFQCRSLQGMYYDIFLAYKIETPVFEGFETDSEFSINAVSSYPLPLEGFDVIVEPKKFNYLLKEKTGSVKRIGVTQAKELIETIKRKIKSNYIYNMSYDDSNDTTMFDIVLEFRADDTTTSSRVLAAFEYIPDKKRLRLVTLY